jgi:hypothetical protein
VADRLGRAPPPIFLVSMERPCHAAAGNVKTGRRGHSACFVGRLSVQASPLHTHRPQPLSDSPMGGHERPAAGAHEAQMEERDGGGNSAVHQIFEKVLIS